MIDWEQMRAIQETLDRLRPLQRQLTERSVVQEALERAAAGPTAQAYLQAINKTLDLTNHPAHAFVYFEETRIVLERALNPLPTFYSRTQGEIDNYQKAVGDAFQRINSAIAAASYLGEVEIYWDEQEQHEEADYEPPESVEEQLIEVVPADVLNQLKRVDFAPVSILDQVLRSPEAMRSLSAREFEQFVAVLIEKLGFESVVLTPRSGDHGRDVVATKLVHGIPILFAFECKRYNPENPVGPGALRALLGTITYERTKANKGVLVTTSSFTSGARRFLLTEPAVEGRDFEGIIEWLREYARQSG